MFWQFESGFVSQIENILAQESPSLQELMDQEDIIQECKAANPKLIQFLTGQPTLEELVSLITTEPAAVPNERLRFKYANLACEILTSDVSAIIDALTNNESLLNKLYNFVDNDSQLNPLLASFFSKTVGLLFAKRTLPVLDFLKTKNFIQLLVNHIETSAIMDLILKFYINVNVEQTELRAEIAQWLHDSNLIGLLVDIFKTTEISQRHINAAQLLCDLTKACREHQTFLQEKATPDPLLESLESCNSVSNLLTNMFTSRTESSLVSGISVLQSLLEYKKHWLSVNIQQQAPNNQANVQQSTELEEMPQIEMQQMPCRPDGLILDQMTPLDAERLSRGVKQVQSAIIPRLDDFHQLLLNPPEKCSLRTTIGVIAKPLGATRLEVAHLITALLSSNNWDILQKFAELKTLTILSNLFFEYPWNNFLHSQVEQIFNSVLNSAIGTNQESSDSSFTPLILVTELLTNVRLIERILEIFESSSTVAINSKKCRPGYMGHLINIANLIAEKCDQNLLQTCLSSEVLEKWNNFVGQDLSEINKKMRTPLVREMPNTHIEDEVYRQQESVLQQAFIEYQMQQMTRNLCTQIGFAAQEFSELNENIPNQVDQLAKINFNFENQMRDKDKTLYFERICQERVKDSLESNSSDEDDLWEDRDITESSVAQSRCNQTEYDEKSKKSLSLFGMMENSAATFGGESFEFNSNDGRCAQMDIDNSDPWAGSASTASSLPMDTNNPWESDKPQKPEDGFEADSWADFSSFAAADLGSNSTSACVSTSCLSSADSQVVVEPCDIPESTTSDENTLTQIETPLMANLESSPTLLMTSESQKFSGEYQENVVSSSTADSLQNGPC